MDAILASSEGAKELHGALADAVSSPVLVWDEERYRTNGERVAVVEKALRLYGYGEPFVNGGWASRFGGAR